MLLLPCRCLTDASKQGKRLDYEQAYLGTDGQHNEGDNLTGQRNWLLNARGKTQPQGEKWPQSRGGVASYGNVLHRPSEPASVLS